MRYELERNESRGIFEGKFRAEAVLKHSGTKFFLKNPPGLIAAERNRIKVQYTL